MRHGSLFSGIGGFDLAADWMGWENVFHCEWNAFGQKVLKHYWPQAISYADITKTDFTIHRGQIDILTGGFPCQPYSMAGKRKGKEDDRHLWPEMLRAVREIQPRWVVGENVFGLVNWDGGLVFDEVQADLEAQGYEVQPYVLPACGVNAPHRRDRVWFVAHRADSGAQSMRSEWENAVHGSSLTSNSDNRQCVKQKQALCSGRNATCTVCQDVTNTRSEQLQNGAQNFKPANRTEDRTGLDNRFERQSHIRNATDTTNSNQQRNGLCQEHSQMPIRRCDSGPTWFEDFPTQSPVCHGDDGFPGRLDGITFPKWRNESIKAGGNAIVPQVAYQIYKAIEVYEA